MSSPSAYLPNDLPEASPDALLDVLPDLPDAAATDPVQLGWMQGFPPPPDKTIAFADGSFYSFPRLRWSFSHIRQLMPTAPVWRGEGQVCALPQADTPNASEINQLCFQPTGSDQDMTWGQAFDACFTDGLVVLHKGRIVYEKYAGALKPQGQHLAHSVTKSVVGLLGQMLVEQGALDENATISTYVPELKNSGFSQATLRQVLDMTTGIEYSENYADRTAHVWQHVMAGGMFPRPMDYAGPLSFYEFLTTITSQGQHGRAFAYKTVNSDVLGWVIARVTGQSVSQNLSEHIWRKLGAEHDAYFAVDALGVEFSGGGLNTQLRDLARLGEMLRQDGSFNGQQIVAPRVVADIRKGGRKDAYACAQEKHIPGGSYRNMWWVLHNEHGAFTAWGIHGQMLYIDPTAQMVIARYASFPLPDSPFNDAITFPAFHALGRYLVASCTLS